MRRVIIRHPKAILFDAIIDAFGKIYIKECNDSIYLKTIEYVINGKYELEFVDGVFKIDEGDVFKNLEKLKENPLYKDKIIIKKVNYKDILEYTNQNKPPINLDKICNFFNIKVEKKEDLTYDGFSTYKNNQYFIFYKSGITSPYRERFTIAHELGHIFLHFSEDKKIFKDEFQEKLDTLNIQKLAARGLYHASKRQIEKEADEFAAELLMPEEKVIDAIFNISGLVTIEKLADHFKVSKQAMKMRLISIGLYNPLMG